MKETRFLKRSKKFALGIALALGCNVLSMGLMSNVEAAEYNTQILGDNTADAVYIEAGIKNGTNYNFSEDTTIKTTASSDASVFGTIQKNTSGNDIVINATGHTLNIDTTGTTGAIAGIINGGRPITINADTLNINTNVAEGGNAVAYGIWRNDTDGRTVATTINAKETNITFTGDNGGTGIAITNGRASRLAFDVNGALNIKSDVENKIATDAFTNNAGVLNSHGNSATINLNGVTNIDMVGNGIVANVSGGIVNAGNDLKITVADGNDKMDYWSLLADNGGTINVNVQSPAGLNSYSGKVSAVNTVDIDGDIYVGKSSKISIALSDAESSLKGVVNNNGNLEMILGSGGSWHNIASNASQKDTISHITTLSGCGGAVFQAADSKDILIDKYGTSLGTYLNVYYNHDEEDPTKILGGNINITSAQSGASIYMVTDYDDNMANATVQNDVLDALANKLFYTGYINGERNLSGYAQIAEGLTTASVTKYYADINFNETTGQGFVADGVVNEMIEGEQIQTDFTNALIGNKGANTDYVANGMYKGMGIYEFSKDTNINTTINNAIAGGPWIYTISTGISSTYGEEQLTLKLNGNDLNVSAEQSGSVVGIGAIGSGKVEIVNPGSITVSAKGTGQTAALFANGGGVLHIANGGENLEDKVVKVEAYTTSSGNGAVIKTMNGISNGTSWLKIDGLVDVRADVTGGRGAGEAISAVASTIDIGGGKIIATGDGTGESNFGGSSTLAIRAYGEFTSQNYGIVNVNVTKDADTVNAKATGAGNNTTQIVGDFSTTGGMGTKGTINIGLNTADSYWHGDYSAGAGFGVTPGDYGCLNLWMGNGADWKGYTRYATNLYMDSGATWEGYAYNNTNNLIMSIKNGAIWTPTHYGTASLTNTNVKIFNGATGEDKTGYIYMSDANGMNVTINQYAGNASLWYDNAKNEEGVFNVVGNNFTVVNAAEGSTINLITDSKNINMDSTSEINNALNLLAKKLYYTGAIGAAESNLKGYVQIAEGLTTESVTLKTGDIAYSDITGQGRLFAEQAYDGALVGSNDVDYADVLVDGVYTFSADITDNRIEAGANKVTLADESQMGAGVAAVAEDAVVIDLQNKNLTVNSAVEGSAGTAILAANDASVTVNNAGSVTLKASGVGDDVAAIWAKDGGTVIIKNNTNLTTPMDAAIYVDVNAGEESNASIIKAVDNSKVVVEGSVYLETDLTKGVKNIITADASTVEIGGGNIVASGDGAKAVVADNGSVVAINVVKDAEGKVVSAGTTNLSLVGDMQAKDADSKIYLGLGEGSSWTGNIVALDEDEVVKEANIQLYLDKATWAGSSDGSVAVNMNNGAAWTGNVTGDNSTITLNGEGTVWTGYNTGKEVDVTLSNGAAWVNNGASKASKLDSVADGNYIKMARDNEASLAIDNYSGNITVFYENSGTEAVGGDITIGNAAEGSEITLVTSNGSKYFATPSEDGTNNTDIFKLKALMNDLAEKLTYNAYVEGERNLTGSVQIAEGLTTASATLVVGDIGFNESTGKGSLVEESMDPETVYPDEQTGTKFTTQLNGVVEDDIKFVQNGILDIDNPGIYDITKATTITQDGDNVTFTVTDTEISTKGEKRGIISSAGDDTTVTLNLHGNTLQLGEKKSANWWETLVADENVVAIGAVDGGSVTINDAGDIKLIYNNSTSNVNGILANNGGTIEINLQDGATLTALAGDGGVRSYSSSRVDNTDSMIIAGNDSEITINGLVNVSADKSYGTICAVKAVDSEINIAGGSIEGVGEANAIAAYKGGVVNINLDGGKDVTLAGNLVTDETKSVIKVQLDTEASTWNGNAEGNVELDLANGATWTGDANSEDVVIAMFEGATWNGTANGAVELEMTTGATWNGDAVGNAEIAMSDEAVWTGNASGNVELEMTTGATWNGDATGTAEITMSDEAVWNGNASGDVVAKVTDGAVWNGTTDTDNLTLTLRNEGLWTVSGDAATKVANLIGGKSANTAGFIDMSGDKAVNVTVDNYTGNTVLLYEHDAKYNINGGTFTINNAAEGSAITLRTDETGIDLQNVFVVNDVLDNLANKLYYTGYIDGERNLDAYVQIAEGLTTASVSKFVGDVAFSEVTGQGSFDTESLQPEIVYPQEQTITEMNVAIMGNAQKDIEYAKAGILDLETDKYTFTSDKTTINKGSNVTLGGWVAGTVNAVISNNDNTNSLEIDLQGNALELKATQTGITAGKNAKIDIYNPGKITIDTNASGMAAGLFVKTGGHIHIHNGGEDGAPASWDNAVVIRTHSRSSNSGVGIKSMSDDSNPDWIKIDGLVDIEGNVAKGQGMGEGLSAVASTIEVGGGKIIMKNDGTGDTNFGGSNQIAIRAYGEFASKDGGIVNVNVTKAEDTYNSAATGAGNNVTQIVGNFSTVGGMGTLGTINVGLNTEDSYWYGNYNAGSGWGVTPGDFGCLNLWMGNGAEWQGYTRYATNLYMDTGATWYGYAENNDNLIMTLKNDAVWTPTTAGTSNLTESKVREFTGAVGDEAIGSIYMSDDNAVNVTVGKYSGETKLFYKHDAAMPSVIYGGNFTIQSAEEGSKITLVTDAEGIDFTSAAKVENVLDSLAGKLFYTGYINETAEDGSVIEGERNLNGYVEIAEGLTTASVTKYAGDIQFSETTGQGNFAEGTLNPEIAAPVVPEIIESFNQGITGNVTEGDVYENIVDEDGTYNFTADETNIVASSIGTDSVGVTTNEETGTTKVDANDKVLNIIATSSKGNAVGIVAAGVVTDEEGNEKANEVVIDNLGGSTISATGAGEAVALSATNGGKVVLNAKDGSVINMSADGGNATVIKAESGSEGGAEVTINGKVNIDVADKNVEKAIQASGEGTVVNIANSEIKVGEGQIAVSATDGANVTLKGKITGDLVTIDTNKPQLMMFALRAVPEDVEAGLTVIDYTVDKEFNGDYVGDADSKLYLTATKGNNWNGNIGKLLEDGSVLGVESRADVTLAGGNWTGAAYVAEDAEFKLNISKGSIWTNTNENTTFIDELNGAESINRGTVGVIRMFEKIKSEGVEETGKGYGDIVVDNYKGSVVFDYALEKPSEADAVPVADEEQPTFQVVGGKVTINKAEAGSEVVLSTAREFIDVIDAGEAEVFAALAEQINLKDKLVAEDLKGYVAISESLTRPEVKLSMAEIDFNTKVDEATGNAQGYIDKDNANIANNVIYGDSETALMSGAKSAMASTAMMWRAESNDLMKRMGDLRMAEGEHGIWAKYYGGKYEMDAQKANFSTSYNAYQVGYDRKVGRGWSVGGALSYSDGNSSYTRGDGETSVMSLGLYGTWKNNDGQYVDLILKRSKLDNEFEVTNTSGVNLEADYEAWATSISAEYGKRIEKGKGFYIDPSVELTLGRVEGEEYDAKTNYLDDYKLRVQQDDFDSLIGRVGLRVGQKLDNASYYAKFAVAKEFCGDYDTKYWTVDGSGVAKYPSGTSMDMGDTWYELQLGGTAKLSDNSMVYASFERSFGGDVEQKWRIDAGLRWSF